MIRQLLPPEAGFTWLDITEPTKEELQKIAGEFGLHETSLEDCLDARHQPKFEVLDKIIFIILRTYDETSNPTTDSIHRMTIKLALFSGEDFLITVHRGSMQLLEQAKEWWSMNGQGNQRTRQDLLANIISEALLSYNSALEKLENDVDAFEAKIFAGESTANIIQEVYWLRSRVSAIRRVFRQSYEVLLKLNEISDPSPLYQDVRERLERYLSITESLKESGNDILNTQLSLSSYRTNEIIRLLTIFSVFFLPLTFIVGVYGMNFHYMPELDWRYGYAASWIVMAIITLGIYWWFKVRGWLK